MQYSDVQNAFSAILNRRDLTPTQLATFMQFGVQRIQREVRVPSMEMLLAVTFDGTTVNLPVPGDYLEMISINTNDTVNQTKLIRTDLQTAIRESQYPGIPRFYCRQGPNFIIAPKPSAGVILYLNYYQDAQGLMNPTDTNWITIACPDLLIYAALSYAADFYLDERAGQFEQRYQQIMTQLQNMANQDELENASITPAYHACDGYPYLDSGYYLL